MWLVNPQRGLCSKRGVTPFPPLFLPLICSRPRQVAKRQTLTPPPPQARTSRATEKSGAPRHLPGAGWTRTLGGGTPWWRRPRGVSGRLRRGSAGTSVPRCLPNPQLVAKPRGVCTRPGTTLCRILTREPGWSSRREGRPLDKHVEKFTQSVFPPRSATAAGSPGWRATRVRAPPPRGSTRASTTRHAPRP